jgi:hypothetical protein
VFLFSPCRLIWQGDFFNRQTSIDDSVASQGPVY